MTSKTGLTDLKPLAPGGHYIALRVGFAFPLEEVNELPQPWVEHYTRHRLMLFDPVIRWIYANTGSIRWSAIDLDDPMGVMARALDFGLLFGVSVTCFDDSREGQRSYGHFIRADREFDDAEVEVLFAYLSRLHDKSAPPTNLTNAELEALRMVKAGQRLKQIAHALGVTEGAVKQRLKGAKIKLGASTGAQAAAVASDFGLI